MRKYPVSGIILANLIIISRKYVVKILKCCDKKVTFIILLALTEATYADYRQTASYLAQNAARTNFDKNSPRSDFTIFNNAGDAIAEATLLSEDGAEAFIYKFSVTGEHADIVYKVPYSGSTAELETDLAFQTQHLGEQAIEYQSFHLPLLNNPDENLAGVMMELGTADLAGFNWLPNTNAQSLTNFRRWHSQFNQEMNDLFDRLIDMSYIPDQKNFFFDLTTKNILVFIDANNNLKIKVADTHHWLAETEEDGLEGVLELTGIRELIDDMHERGLYTVEIEGEYKEVDSEVEFILTPRACRNL